MTFDQWWEKQVTEGEALMGLSPHFRQFIKKLAWDAWDGGYEEGFSKGDYMEGIEEGIQIGRLQP